MKAFTIVLTLVCGLFLSGCYPATTLILLPDESGKVGAITVKSQGELRVIDQAYHSVSTKLGTSPLSKTQALSEAQVNQEYADLIKAQPAKPTSYILYFVSGSTDLVNDSKAIIPQIIDKIKAKIPTEISIIGHTDTKGTDDINNSLSQKRAVAVKKILKDYMPSLDRVEVQSFGSRDQLIPTPPNVNEPRNRRVEILIL